MFRIILILACSLFLSNFCVCAYAADRIVPDQYSTIRSAMSAASAGDRIVVKQGTYPEMIDFTKSNITLTRYGSDNVTITGGTNTRILRFLGVSNCKVEYVNLIASASVQFIVAMGGGNNTNITIDHCTLTGGSATEKWILQDGDFSHNGFVFTNNSCGGRATYDGPIFIANSGGLVFRDNRLDFSGLAPGSGSAFFVEWMNEEAGTNYCYVERNYFYNIGSGVSVAAFMFREADGFYFRNNVIEIKSDYNGVEDALVEIRGMTDGGDSCDNFFFTNNTIMSEKSNHRIMFLLSDTPVNVKITNNLIIGNVSTFAEALSPLNVGSGNLIENNRITDSSVTWANGLKSDWIVRNNYTGQAIVWNNSGNKPFPFYALTRNLEGDVYSWDPINDFNQYQRSSPTDVGAFEYGSTPRNPTPPTPPRNLRIVN